MAINATGSTQGRTTSTAHATGASDLNNGAGAAKPQSASVFDFTNSMALPLTATGSSKSVNDFMQTFKDLAMNTSTWKVGTAVLNNSNGEGWRYATIAITVFNDKMPSQVMVYPMIIEATITRPLEAQTVKLDDLEFKIETVPSMAITDRWTSALSDLVQGQFAHVADLNVTVLAGMTVPATQDLSQQAVVQSLVANAINACVTMLVEVMPEFPDANATALPPNVIPVVRLETTTFADKRDLVGNPIRQDWMMSFGGRVNNGKEQDNGTFDLHDVAAQETTWGTLSGFFDVMYSPVQNSLLVNTGEIRTRSFVARAVITDMQQFKLSSTASNIMMLLPTMALADRHVWMSLMYQRMKDYYNAYPDATLDPSNLGALNVVNNAFEVARGEAPEPAVLIDSTGDPTTFVEYMDKSFTDDVYVALDVPHAASNSWFLSLLNGVAMGDVASMQEFVRGADVLTGGNFSRMHFPNGLSDMKPSDFFLESFSSGYTGSFNARMPDGSYRVMDERCIDYVALQNKSGRQNPGVMQKWSQSWLVDEINQAQRLANRDEVISNYAGKVNHTGMFERHTFNNDLLSNLWNAATTAGLVPELRYIDALRGANTGLTAPGFTKFSGLSSQGLGRTFTTQANQGLGRGRAASTGFGRARNSWGR